MNKVTSRDLNSAAALIARVAKRSTCKDRLGNKEPNSVTINVQEVNIEALGDLSDYEMHDYGDFKTYDREIGAVSIKFFLHDRT